jgi:hypothetical protein
MRIPRALSGGGIAVTKRSDIIDGRIAVGRKFGLVYTRKCGWIDLGHASPVGASELWTTIRDEKGNPAKMAGYTAGYHLVQYSQMMGNRHVKIGRVKRYEVKLGLTLEEKKAVALAIFLDVSMMFESWQSNWFWSSFTNSGFSAEDLASNLVGFYRAVDPVTDFISLCEPVELDVALGIWDKYGAVGDNKNHSPAPYLYPTPGSSQQGPVCAPMPPFLSTITPAAPGTTFREAK